MPAMDGISQEAQRYSLLEYLGFYGIFLSRVLDINGGAGAGSGAQWGHHINYNNKKISD